MRRAAIVGLAALGVANACHSIAGIDDKELDPKYSTTVKPDAAPDVVIADSQWEAGAKPNGWSKVPPNRPPGAPTASGKGARRFFAARNVFFGTVNPSTKAEDPDAWKDIGHTIDTEETTAKILQSDSSNVCNKRPGASADLLVDGTEGRDNVGGHLMSYGASTLSFKFELNTNKDIEAGKKPTYLLMLEDLDNGADDPYVPGAIFITVKRDLTVEPFPLWDGSDAFYVDANTVAGSASDGGNSDGGSAEASADGSGSSAFFLVPRFRFPKGYMRDNIWVSGDFGENPMTIPLYAFDPVNLVDAESVSLVAELTQPHDSIIRSMMSAAISFESMDVQFRPIATKLVECNVVLANVLMGFLGSAMDLANSAPTFEKPGTECGAISMGFAFDWVPVKAPIGSKVVPPEGQCP